MTAKLSQTTARTNLGVLNAVRNAAVDADLLARSPARGIRVAAGPSRERPTLLLKELDCLAEAVPASRRPRRCTSFRRALEGVYCGHESGTQQVTTRARQVPATSKRPAQVGWSVETIGFEPTTLRCERNRDAFLKCPLTRTPCLDGVLVVHRSTLWGTIRQQLSHVESRPSWH